MHSTLSLPHPTATRPLRVPTLQIWALRVAYALMLVGMAPTAWSALLEHTGPWDPKAGMAFTVWAAYGSLALLGLLRPLRMLPIVLFMILYKSLWLAFVAYPLWRAGTLAGTPVEELAMIFVWAPLFALAVPWRYALHKFVLPRRQSGEQQ